MLHSLCTLESETKEALQAVVLGVKASGTSHEGTVFRSRGKALAFTPSYRRVIEWVSTGKFPLLVDTQRGLILPEADVQAITAGWFAHPIPRKVSVVTNFMKPVSREFFALWKEYCPGIATSQLFQMMKPEVGMPVADAKKALYSFMFRLAYRVHQEQKRQITKKASYTDTNHDLLQGLNLAVKQAGSVAQDLVEALERWEIINQDCAG